MKIKSRKEREKEYKKLYGDISIDKYKRLSDFLGDKFNEDLFKQAEYRINEVKKNIKYYELHFTFYEEPIQAHRPRVNFYTKSMHVPNAKDNAKAIEDFVKNLKEDISVISVPMKVILTAYLPMPNNINPLDVLLYETEHDYAIGKPDFDNILKAYCDMIQNYIILDDDIVVSSRFDKYYSLKPRVELSIIYPNGYASEYTYKTIKNRKAFQKIKNNTNVELLVLPYNKLKRKEL